MSLQIQLLNEIDIIILYAILLKRSNKSTVKEIKLIIEDFYPKLYNKPVPSYTYFYQRTTRLRELFFLEKQGGRTYRIKREYYAEIKEYVLIFIKTRFGIKDNERDNR